MTNKSPSNSPQQAQKSWPLIATYLIVGLGLGYILARAFELRPKGLPESIFYFATLILIAFGLNFLHVLIHEGGHLIGGLLTGYRFLSYRVMSFMIVRRGKRLQLARYWLPGTGGQCLMEPPDYKDGTFPFRLYHLGGPGINILSSVIFLAVSFVVPDYPSLVCQIMAVVGLITGLGNGIPQWSKYVTTDGADLITLQRSEAARKSFWTSLKVIALQTQGMRIKDMPAEYFEPNFTSNEYMVAMHMTVVSDYAMDNHDFTAAVAIIEQVLSNDNITGLDRTKLIGDRIYIALLQGDKALAEKLYEAEREKLEEMRKQIAMIRTLYVYAMVMEKEGAEGLLDEFMELSKHHPYEGEVVSEKELIALATTWDNEQEY